MSWGDPYEKFYNDSDAKVDIEKFLPGDLITYGKRSSDPTKTVCIWDEPDLESKTTNVRPGITGIVVYIDCTSETYENWLCLLLSSNTCKQLCWVPRGVVVRHESAAPNQQPR